MQSTFDERNWLAWLVKVRILILTFLLAIQLTVADLTPAPLPLRLFLSTILLWYTLSLFYIVLLSFWQEHRLQARCKFSPTWSWSAWSCMRREAGIVR